MIIFKEIDIGHRIWGHVFEFELLKKITHELDAVELLDEFCSQNSLNELYYSWNSISFNEAKNLLKDCLTFDIAHTSRINDDKEVEKIFNSIVSIIDSNAIKFCFSNCSGSPFKGSMNRYSWSNLTKQTFDVAVILMDDEKIIFSYFMSES